MGKRIPNRRPQPLPKIKDGIHVVNLSSYTAPEVIESKKNNWVGYDEDNMYFKYINFPKQFKKLWL